MIKTKLETGTADSRFFERSKVRAGKLDRGFETYG